MTRIRFAYPRGAGWAAAYQKYYLLGFERQAALRIEGVPLPVRLAPGVTNKFRVAYRLAHSSGAGHVGRYLAELDGREVRFAIDAHDAREIRDPEALDWADVYFKPNSWGGLTYDPKVVSLVNGNGLLDYRHLARLRSLRDEPKRVDIAYISNVWGGREHSLRVFERLAALDCDADLLAILPAGFPAEEDEANAARLRAAGVPVTHEPLPPRELWQRLARARLVPLRAGKHLCFSWRTIDLLAMGACIVFDALPPPRWPVPLEAGLHVADCGVPRPEDTEPAPDQEYERVTAEIERLLGLPAEQDALREAAASYFDEHAAPTAVAGYALEILARRSLTSSVTSSPTR
ncbi:MAG: hypothetical protein QOG06_2630 [Gaiellaceae bacterium]|nr:hypothetical protein [Gaiellaceae bacterium]